MRDEGGSGSSNDAAREGRENDVLERLEQRRSYPPRGGCHIAGYRDDSRRERTRQSNRELNFLREDACNSDFAAFPTLLSSSYDPRFFLLLRSKLILSVLFLIKSRDTLDRVTCFICRNIDYHVIIFDHSEMDSRFVGDKSSPRLYLSERIYLP